MRLTGPVIERFLTARRRDYSNHYSMQALEPLLAYLRRVGAAPEPVAPEPCSGGERLLARFGDYLSVERGLTAPVIEAYTRWVRPFVEQVVGAGQEPDLGDLGAVDVQRFLVANLSGLSRKSAQMTACALRSLLGFCYVEGIVAVSLAEAVPAVAHRKLSGLPEGLTAVQVDSLLNTCDRRTSVGRRDYAVIVCLHRLGLRCAETTALLLDDIDWETGTLSIHGKGGRSDRLPLPVDVGQALVDYLRHGRPDTQSRAVFVRAYAPFTALARSSLSCIVARAARRAGLGTVHAHRLRHTAATRALNAGASLEEVAQLLRHAGTATTLIYAKTDQRRLAGLARRWPTGGACRVTGLEQMVADYLRVRRSLGYKLGHAEYILTRFVDYVQASDAPYPVTVAHALAFATAPPGASPRWQALRLSAIRCFARWAHTVDPTIEVPPARLLPARPTRTAPYIYTSAEIAALLDAAARLRPAIRSATHHTLIALMATTGIRTGEAVGLDIADLDRQASTLTVTGKYGKTRKLPLHQSTAAALTQYLQLRSQVLPAVACPALLISTRGNRLCPSIVHQTFRQLIAEAGLPMRSGASRPRLLSRSGARCRCCHGSVSPDRSPNPACVSPRTGLSTVPVVRRGWGSARGWGSCCPGSGNGKPSPSRSGRTRFRPPRFATARWRRSDGGGAVPNSSGGGPAACGRVSRM